MFTVGFAANLALGERYSFQKRIIGAFILSLVLGVFAAILAMSGLTVLPEIENIGVEAAEMATVVPMLFFIAPIVLLVEYLVGEAFAEIFKYILKI